jgi:hypothetical protein
VFVTILRFDVRHAEVLATIFALLLIANPTVLYRGLLFKCSITSPSPTRWQPLPALFMA